MMFEMVKVTTNTPKISQPNTKDVASNHNRTFIEHFSAFEDGLMFKKYVFRMGDGRGTCRRSVAMAVGSVGS